MRKMKDNDRLCPIAGWILLLMYTAPYPSRYQGFRSVVVITLASHARGPGFDPQRNHIYSFTPINKRDIEFASYDMIKNSLLSVNISRYWWQEEVSLGRFVYAHTFFGLLISSIGFVFEHDVYADPSLRSSSDVKIPYLVDFFPYANIISLIGVLKLNLSFAKCRYWREGKENKTRK